MAAAVDLKSIGSNPVRVRVPLPAHTLLHRLPQLTELPLLGIVRVFLPHHDGIQRNSVLNPIYIQTFLAVVESGNYTAAAEQLHMSQPAVSQHIRALEEQLDNVRLFRRNGQRMIPTHAGEQLLIAARELVELVERTEQNIRSLRGQTVGRVRLGCVPEGEHLLPALLAQLHLQHPAIHCVVRVATSDVLFAALALHELDLLWLNEQHRRRTYDVTALGSEPLHLLAPAQHLLLEHAEVPCGSLREYPLLLPPADTPLRRTLEDGLRKRGLPPGELQIGLECDSIGVLVACVQRNLGLAFVPAALIPATGVGQVALAGQPMTQQWWLLRERAQPTSRAVEEVQAFLQSGTAQAVLAQHGVFAGSEPA